MLRRFSVSNYRSFKEEAVLDFTLTKRDYGQGFYRDFSDGKGKAFPVSTVAGIFGANASGKSVLLKALGFCLAFMKNSASSEKEKIIPVQSWFNNSEPCVFKLEYQNRSHHFYEYHLEVTRGSVQRETLKTKKLYKNKEWEIVYDRTGNDVLIKNDVFNELNYNLIRSNVSVLSLAEQQGANIDDIVSSLIIMNNYSYRSVQGILTEFNLQSVAYGLHTMKKEKSFTYDYILKKIIEFLVDSDTSLVHFDIEEDASTVEELGLSLYKIYGVHRLENGEEKRLLFSLESEGTRVLFSYLFVIFMSLQCGVPVIIDEFDAALHFLIQQKLVHLFNDEDENPFGAQLIFTTHSENLMNTIGKAHIYLTEKIENKSDVWRLDDMKGVRTTDNYRSKYLAGCYGGVPLL